ncbi:GDSL-type esterase/lipase family protein [Nocardioides mangrovi]|uniref:SGNH/GDSL hydrolase family protein n=1 Tax=Nocardioides mangrovi TaxID=2874580 RepID=A0ABS7U8H3_9ACTN|nr:SGNH/GDSL hydrolase family protein [Nocardioides mangrovi]MBZ5737150.1 SGNH/GDSL hydrolase family protein [Nocardioides mangrovi]
MDTYRIARIAWRLILMIGAAILLAWRCREGVSTVQVGIVFILYVAAATLWVRGQYEASTEAVRQDDESLRPYAFPYAVSGLVALVGFVLLVIGLRWDSGTWLLVGAIVAYFALGYLLMRFRGYRDPEPGDPDPGFRGWWRSHPVTVRLAVGGGCLLVSVVLVLVGLLALADGGLAAAAATGVGLLVAPIGLALLAEPATRFVQGRGHWPWGVAGGLAGVVLFGLATGVAMSRVDTPRVALIAFVVIGLLVLAIVSSTQADIAIVIALVCLMGVTNAREPKPDALHPQPGQGRVLVALGDSYMSGEGAKTYYEEAVDEDAGTHENHCNRAPTAWAALAGQTPRLFDSVEFLACSGARTFNVQHREGGEHPPQKVQYNEPATQLDQYDAFVDSMGGADTFTPKLAVISLGGNDSGFSTIGAMCLAPGDCLDEKDIWEGSLPQVETALEATFAQVSDEFPRTPVVVTAYPNPIYADEQGRPVDCPQVTLSPADLTFISEFLPMLNDTVQKAARSQGFFFLADMEDSLKSAHLQLCDPGNNDHPGINYIGLKSVGGIAEQRFNPKNWYHNSLHPNERGHAAMLQVFENWYEDDDNVGIRLGGTVRDRAALADDGSGAEAEDTDAVTTTPCDLVGDDQSTTVKCRDEGTRWAKGQVADKLLPGKGGWWGPLFGLGALGAWLLSVALFGTWKPWWGKRSPSPTGART